MNARQPSPSAQLNALLSRFSPRIVALAKRCLTRLRKVLPGSTQLVYNYNHSVVVAFGRSEHGVEAMAALSIYPDFVRLYFQKGKELPDPKGRLEGSGPGVRYVTLESASDIGHPDVQALFKAALKRSGLKFPRGGTARMIIKSPKSKKPKAKKKAKRA